MPVVKYDNLDPDPLLEDPLESRFVYIPKYMDIHKQYKYHQSVYWTLEEIDFRKDREDFKRFSKDEKHFLLNTMAFFAASDGIVQENLLENFTSEIKMPEARQFLTFQATMEGIHSETYATLLELFSEDKTQLKQLVNAIHTIPAIKAKADFAKAWMDPTRPFAERLIAFVCVEGILFSGSFASIFWLKKFKGGKCPGLIFSNELISRDEGLHTNFGIHLYKNYTRNKPSSERVKEIILEAVDCEISFIIGSFNCALIGIKSDSMKTYIEYIASEICEKLIDESLYDKKPKCPFDWMKAISLDGKTNFFEKKVSEYNKAGMFHNHEEKRNAVENSFHFLDQF